MNMNVILKKKEAVFTYCLSAVFFLFLLLPSFALAASYSVSPSSGSYEVGKTFSVKVMINAGGDAVNAGDAVISFSKDILQVVSATTDGSPFSFPVPSTAGSVKNDQGPAISNSEGLVAYGGGGISPLSGTKAVLNITFKANKEGTAKVEITKGSIMAGAGQSVLSGSTGASYTITAGSSTPDPVEPNPEPKEERKVTIPPPDVPIIKSTTHSDTEAWYSDSNVKFSWDIPYGVLAVKIGFDQDMEGVPTELHKPPVGEWTTSEVADGTWYFHSEYENRGGWGSSTVYKIQIDTTPPEEFEVSANGGDFSAELRFEAKDSLSGISVYHVQVVGGITKDVQPSELVGGYRLLNLDPGEHTIIVTAEDKAGNQRSVSVDVTVTGTVVEKDENVTTSGFGPIYWVSLIFMALLAIVITMLIQERRKFHEEKDHIKRETMEIGDRLINIFGVLRDEIEEKVTELSHKPNMTDNERNILEGLKDALDISEELIDKEVEDVRKLLK